jgi:hypothetical protein
MSDSHLNIHCSENGFSDLQCMTQNLRGRLQVLEEDAEAEGIAYDLPDDLHDRCARIPLKSTFPAASQNSGGAQLCNTK